MSPTPPPATGSPEEPAAVALTPEIFLAGWLGVMSPAVALIAASVPRGGAPDAWAGPALALSLIGMVVAWPLGLLGAEAARAVRTRRHREWPIAWADGVGAFLGGTLGTLGFALCTGLLFSLG